MNGVCDSTVVVAELPVEKASELSEVANATSVNILNLHEDAFQEILSHLNYDEIARLRLVCKHFNETCQKILNKGFMAVQRYHNRCLKEMKAKLPRRESERRTHPLARHIDVLTGIETRLSLLSMTYYKYIVLGVFCFIPGKVLDECYRVLREVIVHKNPPKSYELLQELRDISSMAMEHFEEHIVPTIKKNPVFSTTTRNSSSPRNFKSVQETDDSDNEQMASSSSCPSLSSPLRTFTVVRPPSSIQCNPKIEFTLQQNRLLINNQRKQIIDLKCKVTEHERKILEQDQLLSEYGRKIIQLEHRLNNSLTSNIHPSTSTSTKDPVHRKRPAKEDDGVNVKEGESTSKRKSLMKKPTMSFSMSLRTRKY